MSRLLKSSIPGSRTNREPPGSPGLETNRPIRSVFRLIHRRIGYGVLETNLMSDVRHDRGDLIQVRRVIRQTACSFGETVQLPVSEFQSSRIRAAKQPDRIDDGPGLFCALFDALQWREAGVVIPVRNH